MNTKQSCAADWQGSIHAIKMALESISFRNESGSEMLADAGYHFWALRARHLRSDRKCLYLVGNGASASMSSHFSADIYKNAHVHTQVFTDTSLITAVANDCSYDDVFAEPLRHRVQAGDMLVTISSSGNSPNILKAIDMALTKDMFVVTLSAMGADNVSRRKGHLNIYVPAATYGIAETAHAAILHHWTDMLVAQL